MFACTHTHTIMYKTRAGKVASLVRVIDATPNHKFCSRTHMVEEEFLKVILWW